MNGIQRGSRQLLWVVLLTVASACGTQPPEAAPVSIDEGAQMSTAAQDIQPMACNGTPGEWNGCRGTGCSVCTELVANFPYYYQNHPSCQRNTICYGQYFQCNAACPPPTEQDRTYPAQCNGSPGQWDGCRGTGCSVCAEKVANYPCYFTNHPRCAENNICYGQYYQCNDSCPAPTAADQCYTPPPPVLCGDGLCQGNEPTTCPSDCSITTCGDGICSPGEDCSVDCGSSCGEVSQCADGSCCPSSGVCPDGRYCVL